MNSEADNREVISVSKKINEIVHVVREIAWITSEEEDVLRINPQKVVSYYKEKGQVMVTSVLYIFFDLAQQEKWFELFNGKENRINKVFTLTDKFKKAKFVIGERGKCISTHSVRKRLLEQGKTKKKKKSSSKRVQKLSSPNLKGLETLIQKKEKELQELKDLHTKLVEGVEAQKKLETLLSKK